MPFFTLSIANIQFAEKELICRSYINEEALSNRQRVELINKKKFVKVALDENIKVFVVHVSFLSLGSKILIHPAWEA